MNNSHNSCDVFPLPSNGEIQSVIHSYL